MERLTQILLNDFLKENCPDKFGKYKFTHQVLDRGDGEVILKIRWKIPDERPIYSGFDLMYILAWIYSKQK